MHILLRFPNRLYDPKRLKTMLWILFHELHFSLSTSCYVIKCSSATSRQEATRILLYTYAIIYLTVPVKLGNLNVNLLLSFCCYQLVAKSLHMSFISLK